VNLHPLARFHILDILCDLAGMVSAPFEVPGHHDVVGATRDVLWVFHHVGDPFLKDVHRSTLIETVL
jgi:hypothetical protein